MQHTQHSSSSSSRSVLHATVSADLRLVATCDATALGSELFRGPAHRYGCVYIEPAAEAIYAYL